MRNLLARIALVAILLFAPSLLAQQVTALTGVVTDATGAVISGADVVLTNPSNGTKFTAQTNSAGSYRLANVPPGPGYTLTVNDAGFATFTITNMYLNVADTRTQNVSMAAGGGNTELSVSASSDQVTVNTDNATIGNNFQVEKLNDLPIQSRLSPSALFTLQPGITLDGATTGARTDQTYTTLDGLDVNDFATGNFRNITAGAPVDAIQEFRGTTAGFTADSGFGGGGQFQMVTRRGSNHWHGNAYEYHRDNSTTANDWFLNNTHTRAPKLVQNQFGGSLGGPIKHDKAFFFFNYTASRIAQQSTGVRTVPTLSFKQGNLSYLNSNGGITTLSPADVKAKDPAGIGISPAIRALLNLYPDPNDTTVGDNVNTTGFRFASPASTFSTNYVGRIDYNLTPTMKIWGRGSVARGNAVNTIAQFPGRDPAVQQVDRSYAYVVGMDWTISSNKVNTFSYGTNVQDLNFSRPQNPLGAASQITFATGTTTLLTNPYSNPSNSQARHIPIPQVYDAFNWALGRHSVSLGGTFKWIHTNSSTKLDYLTYTLGLGGNMSTLSTTSGLRPTDLATGSKASTTFDSAFVALLGRVGASNGNYNYDNAGKPLLLGTGSNREYKYYQSLFYAEDTWKVNPHLTLTYGINYQLFSVPYETRGLETVQNIGADQYFSARVDQSNRGIVANNSIPFVTYVLGGPANHGPDLYKQQWNNVAPRLAFAFSPGADAKTVFNGSAAVVYDRTIVNAVQYQQDQFSYIFQQPVAVSYGVKNSPLANVQNDKRLDSPPTVTPPATPSVPLTPWVSSTGVPSGLAGNKFNEMIDPNLKTPYNIVVNAGMQHEFPGSLILRLNYAGRFGRRLLAQVDASQLIDFKDPTSGQAMGDAFANIVRKVRAGANPATLGAEPWFESVVTPGIGKANGYANNTAYVADNNSTLVYNGDFADVIQGLSNNIGPNVGMASQFAENTIYTNKGFSTYHGLLVNLHQNPKHGLTFDVNYTWSHSMDNVSVVANTVAYGGYGFVCDALRPRACRGNSDFDVTHIVNGLATYQLPFGPGRAFGSKMPRVLGMVLGNWDVAAIPYWRSGVAFGTVSSAFVAGYSNNAPAIFTGNPANLKRRVHKIGNAVNLFDNPSAAASSFVGPIGFQIGSRNNLRGPQYFNVDAGLAKDFILWPEKGVKFQVRGDAFNVLNHPNFSSPGNNTNYDDITQSAGTFGALTSMNGNARVVQVSGRIQF